MSTTISAIIPTFRREGYLVNTISGMLNQSRRPDEIIVLDQTPPGEHLPHTAGYLEARAEHGEITLIELDKPSVFTARNTALRIAASDVLLYLDDDITPGRDLVANHLRHYQAADGPAAVVGCVMLYPGEPLCPVPPGFTVRPHVVQSYTFRANFAEPMRNIGYMCAGNFSVRKESAIAAGGWDEHLLNYSEELCLRLAAIGCRVDYDPDARIVHHQAPSGGTRVTDPNNALPAWERCVSLHYNAFRYLHGWMFAWYGLFRAARFSFLLKRNFVRPQCWPRELAGYVKAMVIARRWAKEGVKSPFVPQTARCVPQTARCVPRTAPFVRERP